MSTLPAAVPSVRSAKPFTWHWVEFPRCNPDTGVVCGVLTINGHDYSIEDIAYEHDDGSAGRRFVLSKHVIDAEPYYLDLNPVDGEWQCTCADATFRGGRFPGHVCKHALSVLAAMKALDEAQDLPDDEPQPEPEYHEPVYDDFDKTTPTERAEHWCRLAKAELASAHADRDAVTAKLAFTIAVLCRVIASYRKTACDSNPWQMGVLFARVDAVRDLAGVLRLCREQDRRCGRDR